MYIVVRSYSESVLYGSPRIERNTADLAGIVVVEFNILYSCSTAPSTATVCCCGSSRRSTTQHHHTEYVPISTRTHSYLHLFEIRRIIMKSEKSKIDNTKFENVTYREYNGVMYPVYECVSMAVRTIKQTIRPKMTDRGRIYPKPAKS